MKSMFDFCEAEGGTRKRKMFEILIWENNYWRLKKKIFVLLTNVKVDMKS